MRTVYPPPPPRAPAGSAASTPASRCAPSRTIARTRAGSVRLILSYSAVSDTGRVAPAALTAAWIDGRNPNVTEASKSTTVENSSDRTYCRSACWANSASSHGAASARRSVRCVITVSGLRLTNRSTTASHPIRHLLTPRQRYLAGGHLERGGYKTLASALNALWKHCDAKSGQQSEQYALVDLHGNRVIDEYIIDIAKHLVGARARLRKATVTLLEMAIV